MQIDDPARGLSYKHDGPLDMRLDDRAGRTAADWLARASAAELAAALRDFADEPDADLIAEAVVARRRREPLATTAQLVDLVLAAKGLTRRNWRHAGDLHPAARTFQGLRILVNDELAALTELLRVAPSCLNPGGRIGIISFHSGEDRLVKRAFREGQEGGLYREVGADVIRPGSVERRDNPRSASARLRWAIRGSEPA
jgi:16S rRNA (cytosine1402-N4)-methyltransferase